MGVLTLACASIPGRTGATALATTAGDILTVSIIQTSDLPRIGDWIYSIQPLSTHFLVVPWCKMFLLINALHCIIPFATIHIICWPVQDMKLFLRLAVGGLDICDKSGVIAAERGGVVGHYLTVFRLVQPYNKRNSELNKNALWHCCVTLKDWYNIITVN